MIIRLSIANYFDGFAQWMSVDVVVAAAVAYIAVLAVSAEVVLCRSRQRSKVESYTELPCAILRCAV